MGISISVTVLGAAAVFSGEDFEEDEGEVCVPDRATGGEEKSLGAGQDRGLLRKRSELFVFGI